MNSVVKIFPITKSLPKDYEKWLENYETNGWHLKKVSFGGWLHHFVREQPKKIRYCYDYQAKKRKDYETVFKDVGWELVYYSLGAYIWRIEYVGDEMEAFSDNSSIIGRNNRLLALSLVCFIPCLLTIILEIICYFKGKSLQTINILLIVVFFISVSLIGGLICTNKKINKQGQK